MCAFLRRHMHGNGNTHTHTHSVHKKEVITVFARYDREHKLGSSGGINVAHLEEQRQRGSMIETGKS